MPTDVVEYCARFLLSLVYFSFSLTTATLILFYASLFGDNHVFAKRVRAIFGVLTCAPWLLCFGVRLAVKNERSVFSKELDHETVNIGTHASHIDGLAMMVVYWRNRHRCLPPCAVVKREVLFTPFYGLFALFVGNVFVSRGSTKAAAIESMDKVGERLRNGYVVGAFPEGSRRRAPSTGKDHLLPFKKGVFHMVQKMVATKGLKITLSPFCLVGSRSAWPNGRLIPKPRSKILLHFCDPIEATTSEDADTLCGRTKSAIEFAIEEAARSKDGLYDIDSAFEKGVEVDLRQEFLLNAILLCIPSLCTLTLGLLGLL